MPRRFERLRTTVGLAAILCVGQSLILSSCGPTPSEGTTDNSAPEPAGEQAAPSEPVEAPAEQPAVAELTQGGENPELRDDQGPIVAEDAEEGPSTGGTEPGDATEAAPDAGEAESALSGIPGFVPAAPSGDAMGDDEAAQATGPIPDDAPVIISVRLVELLAADAEALAPLRGFLSGDDAGSLNTTELEALDELMGVMIENGVVGQVAAPRVQVTAGERATVQILQAAAPGQPGSSVSMELAPVLRPAGEDGSRLVELAYDFESERDAETMIEILTTGLGLDIGPRARVAGTAVVASQETFYMVRRFRGGAIDRELLILVRPQVLPGALNK